MDTTGTPVDAVELRTTQHRDVGATVVGGVAGVVDRVRDARSGERGR